MAEHNTANTVPFQRILELGPDVEIVGSDVLAVEKLLKNDKDNLMECTVKADLLHTRLIEYMEFIRNKLHNNDGKIICQYTMTRAFEFKKLLLKSYMKVADSYYTPTMPDERIKIPTLEELPKFHINFKKLAIPKKEKNSIEFLLFHIIEYIEKLFTLWLPQPISPEIFARTATLEFDITKIQAPEPGDPLYETMKNLEKIKIK